MLSRSKAYSNSVNKRGSLVRRDDEPCSSQQCSSSSPPASASSSSSSTSSRKIKADDSLPSPRKTKRVRVPLVEGEIHEDIQEEIDKVYGLSKYRHPNIVPLLAVQKGQKINKSQVLVLKFESSDMDLGEYLQQGLDPHTIKDLTHQILRGLDFLHKQGIVHSHLRPNKIIVTDEGTVKISDYGLKETYAYEKSQKSSDEEEDNKDGRAYWSPELLLGTYRGTATDIWALGCIMAEMYMCTPLFEGSTIKDQLDNIFSVIGTPRLEDWPKDAALVHKSFPSRPRIKFKSLIPEICNEGADLLTGLLRFEHSQRLTVPNSLHHPYFSYKSYLSAAKASDTAHSQDEADSSESE